MTKEEAIERLKSDIYKYVDFTENPNENEFWTAFDMAIKALEAPPNDNWDGYSKRLWKSAYERGNADAEQEPILDKIIAEIKEWYWQADKQALAKDPCVVDAMIDLFIRTIDKYKAESEEV